MKTNRILTSLLAGALAVFSLSSCLFEQKDLFEDSASVRLTKTLAEAHTVLQQQNAWLMYYFPDNDQYYGGYNYIVKFTAEEATVWSELFDGASTSLYRMTTNNGPVLSFDTNNYNFHYFATPSGGGKNLYGDSGKYQAHRGDFEFLILEAKPEEVRLKGTRSGSICVLVPFSGDPEAYLTGVNRSVEEIFVSEFNGTIGSSPLHVFLDLTNRQAQINLTGDEDNVQKAPYLYTDKGIRLYQPVTVGGGTFQELQWLSDSQQLVSGSGASAAISLTGTLPEGWHAYNDYLGTWRLTFNGGKSFLDGIEIKEDEKGRSFLISGLSHHFDMKATYNLGSGKASLLSQIVGKDGTHDIRVASWDSKAGKVNYGDAIGFFLTFGANAEGVDDASAIYFSDNRTWLTYSVSGFIIYIMNGSTRVGHAVAPWIFRTAEGSGTAITTDFNRLATPTVLTRVK